MRPRAHRTRTRTRSLVAVVAVVLVSCSSSGDNDASSSTSSTTEATTTTEPDPTSTTEDAGPDDPFGDEDCIDTTEVAELVGVDLDRSIHFGSNFSGDISFSSTGCSYRPTDGTDSSVTIGRITTEAPLRDPLFDVLDAGAAADAAENGFSPLDDLGDDAFLDGREVVVKDGSAMLFVEYDPGDDAELGDENPAIDLAADVVDLGLSAGEAPDCDALGQLVSDRFGPVADTTPSGGFIGLNDISITTEGCAFDLGDETEIDISVAAADQWDAWVAERQDSVFTSSYEPLEIDGLAAFDDGEALIVADDVGDSPWEISAEGFGLDAAAAAALRLELAELVIDG